MILLTGEPLLVAAQAEKHYSSSTERCWIERDADWDTLYPKLTQTNLFDNDARLDIRFLAKKLDAKGQAFFKYIAQAGSATKMICQAPFLQLPPTLSALFKNGANPSRARQQAGISALTLVECKPLKGKALIDYIAAELKKKGCTFENTLPATLAHFTEGNLLAAQQCVMQLALLQTPLTAAHLEPLLSDAARFPLYALNQACLEGSPPTILRIMAQFKQDTDIEPLLVLWSLSKLIRQLRALHQKTTFEALHIWSSQANSYRQACKRLPLPHLTTLLHQAQQLDWECKSKSMPHVWDKLEVLALQLVR